MYPQHRYHAADKHWHVFALVLALSLLAFNSLMAQSHRYYTYSFSEESSLLAGAVIGGGSGTASIFYNPAMISATGQSSFSLNTSLVYFEWCSWDNALGKDYDLKQSSLAFRPRFISYLVKSKLDPKLTFELATFSKETYNRRLTFNDQQQIDILLSNPGDEVYIANYVVNDEFGDYWLGLGGSYQVSKHLSVGASLFGLFKTLEYWNVYDLSAFEPDDQLNPESYIAIYEYRYHVKFNDYRLLLKAGIHYNTERMDFGIKAEFPSLGVYEDGKQMTKNEKQLNIMKPDGSGFFPDYLIEDTQVKKQVSVNYKDPFSLGAGIAYQTPDLRKTYYVTMEYFHKLKPYVMVKVKDHSIVTPGVEGSKPTSQQWMECTNGAKPMVNLALGAKWRVTENALILAGFRTDFNTIKNFDYGEYEDLNQLITESVDMYHFSFGTSFNILKNVVNTGISYSVGQRKNLKQLVNLSDPVEYNTEEQAALQGTRTNTMNIRSNQINLFLGLTLNWPNLNNN
jgi:hypothetical protein